MVRVLGLSSFVAWAACVCARSSPQLDTVCEEEELEEFSTLQLRGVLDVAATGPKSGMFGMEEHENEDEDVEADDDDDDDKSAVILGTDDQVKSPILLGTTRVSAQRWMQFWLGARWSLSNLFGQNVSCSTWNGIPTSMRSYCQQGKLR